MDDRYFPTIKIRVYFPFHKKKFACAVWIYLALAGFAGLTAASSDVQQLQAIEAKQLIKQAKKLVRRGEFIEAEKILRQIVERNPKDSNGKLALSYVLFKLGSLPEAYKNSLEVAQKEPRNSYAFAVLGVTLLSAGDFKDAKLALVNAVKLDGGEALGWWGLGMLDFYENRIYSGVEKLQEAVYFEPNEADFLYSLAQVSARAENYKKAAETYRRFLAVAPRADTERRDRIKGLINFLEFLGNRDKLYILDGEQQTKVAFKLIDDRPVIQIRLQKTGEPLNFVLDTGSGVSVISDETAQKMNIKPVARGGLARGLGGDGKFEIVYGFLPSVYIGAVKIKGVPVYIRQFHSPDKRIDGYIGLSLISKFLTTIDYGDSTFALINQNLEAKEKSDGAALSIPLRLTSSGFLSGEVALEGVELPLNFVVDTGATLSVISNEVAGSKEISRFIKNEKMRVIGSAGITENVSLFMLPRISFGKHSREKIPAVALNLDLINESSGFRQAGILGGNFLKNYRLTFDFRNSRVVFVPVK